MNRTIGLCLLALTLACVAPAPAQLFFAKKPKVNPSQRVPELILIVKTDADERKRASAAEELRDYDTATFTEIVPVLVDVLKNDKKLNVRLEALNSLAKIRPVSTMAGQAIEKAAADDEAFRVRMQAKASLPKYHLAGYTTKKSEPAKKIEPAKKKPTDEPPLLPQAQPQPKSVTFPRPLPPGTAPAEKTPLPPPVQQGPTLFP